MNILPETHFQVFKGSHKILLTREENTYKFERILTRIDIVWES